MKYGVIVCPKCGRARGVESAKKTTTCQCGREIKLSRMKLRFMTDSPHELAESVAAVNAALKGGGPMPSAKKPKRKSPYLPVSEKVATIKDPLERARAMVAELSAQKKEFDVDDVKKIAVMIGKETPENLVAKLLNLGIIYEVGPGRYRAA